MRTLLNSLALAVLATMASPQDPSTEASGEAAAILRETSGMLRALSRISEALPRGPLEPEQLVDHVSGKKGDEAETLTDWIAQSIGWLPYRGALRGPRGVLIERRGNSLDQALLLAEALRAAGREVRLAHAVLPVELAQEMYAAVRPLPSEDAGEAGGHEGVAEPAGQAEVDFGRFAELIGTDEAQLRRAYESLAIQSQQYLERVLPLAVGQAQDLERLLTESGVAGPAEPDNLEQQAIETLRDHWWVQASKDGQTWVDHDPLARRAGVELDGVPATTHLLEELPDGEKHRLTLRVVAERLDSSGLTTEVVLTHEVDTSTLAGSHFVLGFRPLNPQRAGAPDDGEDEAGAFLSRLATAETEWLPVLLLVDYEGRAKDFNESSIYTDGTLNRDPRLDTNSRKLGEALSALDSADSKPVARDSQLTAVQLEYEIAAPGRAPRLVRRNLFDLLGEASRRAGGKGQLGRAASRATERGLALLGQTQILPATCRFSEEFGTRLIVATQLRNTRLMVDRAQAIVDEKESSFGSVANSFAAPPFELFMLARMRLTVGRHANRVHPGALNVFATHLQPFEPAEGTAPVAFARAIDIVANDVDVLAPRPGQEGASQAWGVRLEQGVLDTILENLSLQGLDQSGGAGGQGALTANPALWLERHPIGQWTALDDEVAFDAGASDTLARIDSALARGQVAVVPQAALADAQEHATVPGCWWRVDTETGTTLGIGPRGWGRGDDEYLATVSTGMRAVRAVGQFGRSLACIGAVVAVRMGAGYLAGVFGGIVSPDYPIFSAVMAVLATVGYSGRVYNALHAACKKIAGL